MELTEQYAPASVPQQHWDLGPYPSGPFAPVTAEVDVTDLQVEGELPAELDGAYIRNGPNPRFPPIGSYHYPLDGDGMLHRVVIADGRQT
jgi:carotenoid cleavage dioxygenase-like enzyme